MLKQGKFMILIGTMVLVIAGWFSHLIYGRNYFSVLV